MNYKQLLLSFTLLLCTAASYGQYRWEVSGGALYSTFNVDSGDTDAGVGFYVNAGYGYLLGNRARTSIVFSLELLQRNSEITSGVLTGDVSVLQVGFSPKFRYLFGENKDKFRAFLNVGPSFRVNTSVEVAGVDLESENFEQVIIGGVYGGGASLGIGEMVDVMAEAGVMNDFVDNLQSGSSKFFDIYLRVGIRFRIYDARR